VAAPARLAAAKIKFPFLQFTLSSIGCIVLPHEKQPRRDRRNAVEAQRQADRANNEIDRASWLRLVQGWLSLLPKRPQNDQEAFDQEVADKGTGQDESKTSN
jgi:hypothetical protein